MVNWGLITPEDKAVKQISQRQLLKGSKDISNSKLSETLERQAYAKEHQKELKSYLKRQARIKLGLEKKKPIISRQQLKSSFASIGREIERENNQFDRFRSNAPGTSARAVVQPRRNPFPSNNFFEHKSEYEIYGDEEGLTFFDSNKKGRANDRTGSLFGI